VEQGEKMIPAWLGIPGLVVFGLAVLIVLVLFIGTIVILIEECGFRGIFRQWRKILFFISFFILVVIGETYLEQLLNF
jgi:hypothetical protein